MADRSGLRLGHYQVLRRIGNGGFAEVHLGRHELLDTYVAIKLFNAPVADVDMPDFLQEARIIASLDHQYIIPVLDCGVECGIPYLVMKHASGGTLRQQHPHGTRLAPSTIIRYAQQLAEALQYAHERRIIHRDVKPENMLLGNTGQLYISDFGIAMRTQTSVPTQQPVGTWAYMAPEQFDGRPVKASDQYALGVAVYEWICGERPFQGSQHEIYTQHLYMAPPSLQEKVPELPLAVEQVVFKALAKDPQARFKDVSSFSEALKQAYHHHAFTHLERRRQQASTVIDLPPKRPVSNAQQVVAKTPPPSSLPPLPRRQQAQPLQASPTRIQNKPAPLPIYPLQKLGEYLEWLLAILEFILALRFLLRLLGADPTNLFADFLYALTNIILLPFSNIVASPRHGPNQAFEWPTLIAMGLYWIIIWAIRQFISTLTPTQK